MRAKPKSSVLTSPPISTIRWAEMRPFALASVSAASGPLSS
jgi:hypothetical protein